MHGPWSVLFYLSGWRGSDGITTSYNRKGVIWFYRQMMEVCEMLDYHLLKPNHPGYLQHSSYQYEIDLNGYSIGSTVLGFRPLEFHGVGLRCLLYCSYMQGSTAIKAAALERG
jgi:hypothetical protein